MAVSIAVARAAADEGGGVRFVLILVGVSSLRFTLHQ